MDTRQARTKRKMARNRGINYVYNHRDELHPDDMGYLKIEPFISHFTESMLRQEYSEMINRASLVVTMGCSVDDACRRPMLAQMQKKLVDWDLPTPRKVNRRSAKDQE